MEAGADISKLVGAIMQNPELIERIKALAGSQGAEEAKEQTREPESLPTSEPVREESHGDRRRRELLCALKPYVSKDRAKAIDSILSFATVFNIIKEK